MPTPTPTQPTQRIIEVIDYQSVWFERYQQEHSSLQLALSTTNLVAIHHIGSTSVAGLCAKPVIDILLEVESLEVLDRETPKLAALGYVALGECGIAGRRYFHKGGDLRSHQIHAFLAGSFGAQRHLAFRDYLRAFPDIAAAYGKLKREAAKRCNNDITRYCELKNDFIQTHQQLALVWHEKVCERIGRNTSSRAAR